MQSVISGGGARWGGGKKQGEGRSFSMQPEVRPLSNWAFVTIKIGRGSETQRRTTRGGAGGQGAYYRFLLSQIEKRN